MWYRRCGGASVELDTSGAQTQSHTLLSRQIARPQAPGLRFALRPRLERVATAAGHVLVLGRNVAGRAAALPLPPATVARVRGALGALALGVLPVTQGG